MLLRAGTPYASFPHVVWDGYGHLVPAPGYAWRSSDPSSDGYSVVALPAGAPHPSLPNVVWAGDGSHFLPADGYTWASADPNDDRTVLIPGGTAHRTLPHVVWAGNGRLEPASGYQWASQDSYLTVPLPYGTLHLQYPHVMWDGHGRLVAGDGYRFVNNAPAWDRFRVEPLPAGTPHDRLSHVVWAGDGHSLRPADGYRWASSNPAADGYKAEPLPRGTPSSKYANLIWDGQGSLAPAPGYRWAHQSSSTGAYQVEPLPANTPHEVYPHVVWSGDGKHIMPQSGYRWASDTPAADRFRVALLEEEKLKRQQNKEHALKEAQQQKALATRLLQDINKALSEVPAPKTMLVAGLQFKTSDAVPGPSDAKTSPHSVAVPAPAITSGVSEPTAAVRLATTLTSWLSDPMHRDWLSGAAAIALWPVALDSALSFSAAAGSSDVVSLWEDRPVGLQVRRYGDWWVKRVNPDASPIAQSWARANIQAQYEALQSLGQDMAAPNQLRNEILFTRHVGPTLPDGSRFLNPVARDAYLRGSVRMGTFFNDIQPRNMGANGIIFDPAIDPVTRRLFYGAILGEGAYAAHQMSKGRKDNSEQSDTQQRQ